MQPNDQTQSHHNNVEHHRNEPPLKPQEILQSSCSAEGMPVEWAFERANLLNLNLTSLLS